MPLSRRLLIAGAGLLAAAMVALTHPIPSVESQRLYALVVGVVGAAAFILHGGSRITVAGLYSIATALFIGYSGWVVSGVDGASPAMNTVLGVSAASLSGSVIFFGREPRDVSSVRFEGGPYLAGLAAMSLVALFFVREVFTVLTEAGAFMAVVVIAVALVFGTKRVALWAPLIMAPPIIIYGLYFHGGTGRLRLIGLLGAIALVYSARYARWWHKSLLVAVVPVGLQLLARYRLDVQRDIAAPGTFSSNSGLESMYAPPRAFASLVRAQAETGWPLKMGSSFFTPIFAVVPDSLRPTWMPQAFNYELVGLTNPDRYGSGYSTAGSWFGEWWWNFGALGLVACALVTGPLLSLLDRAWTAAMTAAPRSRRWVLVACVVLAIAGAVGDLAWGGTHTWLVRGLTRVPLVLILCFVVGSGAGSVHKRRRARVQKATAARRPVMASVR